MGVAPIASVDPSPATPPERSGFRCVIPGDPRGKGSVRVGRGFAYKDGPTEAYMGTCILFMRAAKTGAALGGPLSVTIEAFVRRPQSLIPKAKARTPQPPSIAFPCTAKPDVDNIAKIILDSLTQSGVIVDDKGIASLTVRKWYAAVGTDPAVFVTVSTLAGASC